MKKNFLPLSVYVYLSILSLFLLIYVSWKAGFLIALLMSAIFFLFRRKKVIYRDNLSHTKDILTAPINGQVLSITNDYERIADQEFRVIRIVLPLFFESGVYSPASAELVEKHIQKGKNFFRYSSSLLSSSITGQRFKFYTNTRREFYLSFLKSWMGGHPRLWTMIGDRASSGGCLGFLPFGGTVLLYIPKTSEVFVKENDMLIAGQTSVAGFD